MRSNVTYMGARCAAVLLVLGGFTTPVAADNLQVPSRLTEATVGEFLAEVQHTSPALYAKHAGYAYFLLSGRGTDHAALRELLTELAAGEDVLGQKRGWVAWAHRSRLDSTGQPFSLYLPDRLGPDRSHPLFVRLHDLGGDHRSRHDAPSSPKAIVLVVNGRGNNFYLGPGTVDVIESIEWAKSALPIDPQRVYLDGVGMGANGAFHIAAMHGELISGIIARDPWPTTEISERLAGMSILIMHSSASLTDPRYETKILLQQLTRAGAVVDTVTVEADRYAGSDDPRLSSVVERWAAQHVGVAAGGDATLFGHDVLYGLFDGEPVRIVTPSGGDDHYRSEVDRMARYFATGGNFAQPEPGSWIRGVGSPMGYGAIPIVRDVDMARDGVDAHWIVLGSPETNTVLAEQLARGPVRFEGQRISLPAAGKSYPTDLFGIVEGQPNVLNPARRVLVVASTNPIFFRTHTFGPVVPNAQYPMTRRRPDVAVLAAQVPVIAAMHWTDDNGNLLEPSDPRLTPADVRTLTDLDRLKADSALRVTDSQFAIAATSPQIGSRQIIAPANLTLSALKELIGDEQILTIELTGVQLAQMLRDVNQTHPVALFPTDGRVSLRAKTRYRLAVGMSQIGRIAQCLPGGLGRAHLRIADETVSQGVELVMGRMGDLDRDGDVDGEDLKRFDACFSQQRFGAQGECGLADLDGNGRIDAEDFATLKRQWRHDHRNRFVADRELRPEDLEDWILSVDR